MTKPTIRDSTQLIGMIERGDAAHDLMIEIKRVLDVLRDLADRVAGETELPLFEGAAEA